MNELMPTRLSNVTTVLATGGYTIGGTFGWPCWVHSSQQLRWPILFLLEVQHPVGIHMQSLGPGEPAVFGGAGRNLEAREVMQIIAAGPFPIRASYSR